MQLHPNQAFYLLINNRAIPSMSSTLAELYRDDKDKDGYLYMTYASHEMFGCLHFRQFDSIMRALWSFIEVVRAKRVAIMQFSVGYTDTLNVRSSAEVEDCRPR